MKLLNIILGDEVRQFSLGALDFIQCGRKILYEGNKRMSYKMTLSTPFVEWAHPEFTQIEPIKGFDAALLLECFADVLQLGGLFVQYDFSACFHDFGEKASKIPEAARDKEKVLAVLKKVERDKKKHHETILKQLRELPQTSQ
ncbi:unnamed protein product [Orchesella dallaii]|uniref:Uncharacterized protein n=1 Tax=Orchesella dallaii TaxID=48710 RepID=A0ABP1QLU9_9HEXA